MKAFHSFWTAPNRLRGGGLSVPDYEVLTMMLSALEWRRHNGPITMVTDSEGAAFLKRAGLGGLWSEPIRTDLDKMDPALDPALFWAAGKLEALRRTPAPCVMLDTDMVVWSDLGSLLGENPVAAHREELMPEVYPDPLESFRFAADYQWPPEWDLKEDAANTAFLYIPDEDLKNAYVDAAFAFMCAYRGGVDDPVMTMCTAEQRILPMCVAARGAKLDTLLDQYALDEQDFITHVWGHKTELAESPELRVRFCLSCTLRLMRDFPAWNPVLAANPQTAHYYRELAKQEDRK